MPFFKEKNGHLLPQGCETTINVIAFKRTIADTEINCDKSKMSSCA